MIGYAELSKLKVGDFVKITPGISRIISKDFAIVLRTDNRGVIMLRIERKYTNEEFRSFDDSESFATMSVLTLDEFNKEISKIKGVMYDDKRKFFYTAFKPFDRVLVFDEKESRFKIDFFSHYAEYEVGIPTKFVCMSGIYSKAFPTDDNFVLPYIKFQGKSNMRSISLTELLMADKCRQQEMMQDFK